MATPNFSSLVSNLRQVFRSGKTKSLQWRKEQLSRLLQMLDENKDQILEALKKDLNKSKFEGMLMEIDFCRNDIITCLNNIDEWVKPEKVKKNLVNIMDKAYIRREPFGVALIIGAWNYPIQLTILPLIGAISAGNCAVLKPSEISPATASALNDLLPKYLDTEAIRCVLGAIPETTALLQEKWDYIFYTGNSMVGKIVMRAATENLTPVTLELGGKSPVYVDSDADLGCVANRILWGKCTNAGQTCVAPDYVMCTKETQDALVEKMRETLKKFYPDGPEKSPDYCRLVTDRHYQRVKKHINGGGKIAIGGDCNDEGRYIAPTVLTDVSFNDPIMQDEIFGPVLPVCPVKNEDEAINYILDGAKPLAFYIFTSNNSMVEKWLETVQSGGCCVNDILMQGSIPTLPFGGVGNSGMGCYHGKFSFETFSHKRAVMHRELRMEAVNNIRYPPFTDKKRSVVNWLMKKNVRRSGIMSLAPWFIFGTLFAILIKVFLAPEIGIFKK